MIRYTISYSNALNHLLEIVVAFESDGEGEIDVMLPVWRPGRYELADFAKNILRVSAKGSVDGELAIKKVSKSAWKISSMTAQTIEVSYQYYAFKMDAGNSWLHDDQLYINPVNCLMYLSNRMNEASQLWLEVPDNYEIACALPKEGKLLRADSFYQLADSPMIASALLTHLQYEVGGIDFHLWYKGSTDAEAGKMVEDFRKFTQAQLDIFGGLPAESYHFLLQFLPHPAYHGVEHANSTVITLGPCSGEHTGQFYERLMGISSHELFHAWNITRIRPAELWPYDFSRENYFETGYVAEGFTTYYGDLMLVRSGVYDELWYLKELNNLLARHFQNFGRYNQSVTESSFDLWLDGYQAGIPNRKVSIYVKGAVIALMLDLTLRQATDNQKSLDDLVRVLWNDYFQKGRGYEKQDILRIAEKLAGRQLQSFFEKYVDGNVPVEHELARLVEPFGLTLSRRLPEAIHEKHFGFRLKKDADKLVVSHIHPGGEACLLLSVDDEVANVNGETEPEKMLVAFSLPSTLTIKRHGKAFEALFSEQGEFYETFALEKRKTKNDTESTAFNKWLKG